MTISQSGFGNAWSGLVANSRAVVAFEARAGRELSVEYACTEPFRQSRANGGRLGSNAGHPPGRDHGPSTRAIVGRRGFLSPRRRDEIAPPVEAESVSEANTESRYEVTRADLPLSCPMPDMAVWNSHPKVYLPVEETGEAKCPYCGADFRLIDR